MKMFCHDVDRCFRGIYLDRWESVFSRSMILNGLQMKIHVNTFFTANQDFRGSRSFRDWLVFPF